MRSKQKSSLEDSAITFLFVGLTAASGVVGTGCSGGSGSSSGPDAASPGVDSSMPPFDAGVDSHASAPEAGADAAPDATTTPDSGPSTDAEVDATEPVEAAPIDAGMEAAIEAGPVDAGVEAAIEAGPVDAGVEAQAEAGFDAGDGGPGCNGVCVVLANNQDTPFDIATNGVNVYWTDDNGTGTIMSLSVNGGSPVAIVTGQSYPYGIALDSTNVYWTNYHAGVPGGGNVMKVALDGGTPVTVATGRTGPAFITVDSTNLYWPEENDVASASIAGVAGPVLASPGGSYVASGPSGIYWAGEAVDIATTTPGSSSFTTLTTKQFPEGIAVDSTYVYFANSANNISSGNAGILRMPLAGGSPTTLASGALLEQPVDIAIDGTNIYWTDLAGGRVMKVDLNGSSPPTLLAWGQALPYNLAIDSTSVYWTNQGNCPNVGCSGTVMKLTPK